MTGLRIYKNIVDVLSDFIYIVILLYAFVAIPYLFGFKPMIVATDSMNDAYSKGSIVYYRKTAESNLKEGDVITFTYEGSTELITHRINAINGDKYQTKADSSDIPDPILVSYSEIKGEVSKIYLPYLGTVFKYITSHIYLVIVAGLILIAEFILNSLKIFNKDLNSEDKDTKKKKKNKEPEEEMITNINNDEIPPANKTLNDTLVTATAAISEEQVQEPILKNDDIELPILVNEKTNNKKDE